MNEEMKEILEQLQKCISSDTKYHTLSKYELSLLLDYITNLQQRCDYLEDIVSNTELSDEIKKADKISKRELYKWNYQRLKANLKLHADLTDYKSRCEKAIDALEELIAEFQLNNYITDFDKKMKKPLNILQGSDKE